MYNQARYDAIDGPLNLARHAEYFMQQIVRAKYPDRKARLHIPPNTEGSPGLVAITTYHIDRAGRAQITATPGRNTPKIELTGAPQSLPVLTVEAEYGINFREVERADFAGINLDPEKALATRRAIEDVIDETAYLGSSDFGLTGLFSPSIPRLVSPINFNDPAVTADEAVNALTDWATEVYTALTNTTFKVDSMVVPPKLLTYMNKKRNNGANRDTVMKEFRESNSYIKMVDDATWAATAGTNGSPALIFYVRDPDHLELHLPGAFQQKIKFQSEVDTSFLLLMDTAGVRHKRLSALIVEGFWY